MTRRDPHRLGLARAALTLAEYREIEDELTRPLTGSEPRGANPMHVRLGRYAASSTRPPRKDI
jgi:hypothetical protein